MSTNGQIKRSVTTVGHLLLFIVKGIERAVVCFVEVNKNIMLRKQEALIFREEEVSIYASGDAELVLFITDKHAATFKGGMFSGNTLASN